MKEVKNQDITAQELKEKGEYLGFSDSFGYVYRMNEKVYAYNRNGIVDITDLEIVL